MSDRDFPYESELECDECGIRGGYDLMGDYLCKDCWGIDQDDEECEHLHVEDLGAGASPRLDCLDCGGKGYMVFDE